MFAFKKSISLILLLSFISIAIPVKSFATPEEIKLPAGTPVILKLTEEVGTRNKHLNDIVNFEVARDVLINGKILIKSGTPGTGTVTWFKKPGRVGSPGEIQFTTDMTKAVDGQSVMLKSSLTKTSEDELGKSIALSFLCCIFFLLMKGDDAVFLNGTEIKVYTDGNVLVQVE